MSRFDRFMVGFVTVGICFVVGLTLYSMISLTVDAMRR